MKIVSVALLSVLVSTSAFANDIVGDWKLQEISCSGGSELELSGQSLEMSVNATQIIVSINIDDLPGCTLRQVSNYKAEAGKLMIVPFASSATEQCGEEFEISLDATTHDYVVDAKTLKLMSVATDDDSGCHEGETSTTILNRK